MNLFGVILRAQDNRPATPKMKNRKRKPKKTQTYPEPNRTVMPIMTQFGASKFMFIP